jgi:hypothetical protein
MANLSISAVCNQQCAYCFAQDWQTASDGPAFVSLAEFTRQLDFLDRSSIDQVRLLGGEPTLHPQFIALSDLALARHKSLMIFTNGLMPKAVLEYLSALPEGRLNVMVNINEPESGASPVLARQRDTLHTLGARAHPGFNIYRQILQLDFLLPLIAETGCRPTIRLGLAHPCLSGHNRHVQPHQYAALGEKIVRFVGHAAPAGVRVEFDCGFVPCMFSEAARQALRAAQADVGWHCNPILDVDAAGRAIHCYPLAALGSLPVTADSAAGALRATFEDRTRPYRAAGIYPECAACPARATGECPGGCLAATLRRFRPAEFRVETPL